MAGINRMDREWLNAEIDAVIRDIGSVVKREVADALIARMRRATEHGDAGYMPLVWAMAGNGITRAVGDRIRQEHDMVRVTPDSRVVSLPKFGSVKHRDGDGLPESNQMSLWEEMSRAEFDEMVDARMRRHDTEGKVIATYMAMQKVWDMHPQARNVVDAIRIAGMSLADFGIDFEATA